jgi:metal transporter CNNM
LPSTAPIAYPIAKLLDAVLGADEGTTYKKAELKSFLQFHRQGQEPLRDDEIAILNGVLELNTKEVEEIMTPIKVNSKKHVLHEGEEETEMACRTSKR